MEKPTPIEKEVCRVPNGVSAIDLCVILAALKPEHPELYVCAEDSYKTSGYLVILEKTEKAENVINTAFENLEEYFSTEDGKATIMRVIAENPCFSKTVDFKRPETPF